MYRCLIVLLLLLLGACATSPGGEHSPAATPAPTSVPRASATAPANTLLQQARRASGEGNYPRAVELLERALRIDAQEANLYLELSRAHRAQGNSPQAELVAERGLLYCRSSRQCQQLRRAGAQPGRD